jgi:serine/threonine protein kinase
MLFDETEALELLSQNHHPNLVRCHGCTVNHDQITGIALDKHEIILQYRYEDVPQDLNIVACIEGIHAGIHHLHFLGFAHNDLNSMNIALDHNVDPIILDFGSCRPFGKEILSAGTYGWIDADYCISAYFRTINSTRSLLMERNANLRLFFSAMAPKYKETRQGRR